MKRVLQELPSLDGGGIAKLLYEYYSQMEHDKIHFDFIIYSYYDEGIYEMARANGPGDRGGDRAWLYFSMYLK